MSLRGTFDLIDPVDWAPYFISPPHSKKCSDPVKILMVCNGGPKDKFSPLMVQVAYRLFRSASDGLADHRDSTLTIASMADDLAMWWMNNREKRHVLLAGIRNQVEV